MKFDFYTFGGGIFWEDVFFYQKWRIQRNCFTKKYRLLDSWDIRRASGSFDDCKNAFIQYIESHEITKQKGRLVVLLHGYMDGKNIFKPLWRKLVLTNSTIVALNYPSLFRNSIASAHQLLFFLNHIDDIGEVSFVTKGAGNLVLQNALNLSPELQIFRESMRIRNIVKINPVLTGNLVCDFLSKFRIFKFIFGPMITEMTESAIKNTPLIPPQINNINIYSYSRYMDVFLKILKALNFPVEDKMPIKKKTIIVKNGFSNVLKNPEVLNFTIKFINNGKI